MFVDKLRLQVLGESFISFKKKVEKKIILTLRTVLMTMILATYLFFDVAYVLFISFLQVSYKKENFKETSSKLHLNKFLWVKEEVKPP